ncbi:MAG: sulfite exporter TauE/SafE family protein [Oligoflexia bacterium]|nr:sulfite exporter TauE/SafE family protein [Oligoflexia bacterium]
MSGLISESHRLIPLAVLGASLAGSLHCVGMCGPLVTAAARGWRAVALYQLGRLFSYAGLGALAGYAGERIFSTASSETVPRLLQWLAALAIAGAFFHLGFRSWRGRGAHLWGMPRYLARLFPQFLHGRAGFGASAAGALSALLPCGWLHGFVLAAVTAREAGAGSALLALFWAGTLPALTAAPAVVLKVLAPATRRAPRVTALLLVAAGLATLGMKFAPALRSEHGGHPPSCHAGDKSSRP